MKKTKVENISGIKLEFFLRQNKEDVRVILNPGESTWCNHGTTTKSMILYERKNLIKSSDENIQIPIAKTKGDDKMILDVEEISIKPILAPIGQLFYVDFKYESVEKQAQPSMDKKLGVVNPEELTPIEKAKKETEEYKKESERTYKGKKRGRKKKRGPKPGSKRKKNTDNPPADIQS